MMQYTPPADTGLDLYYVDEHLLVVNKPAGLLSVPGRGEDKQDCMINRVMRDYPDAFIVHRLDMDTSGLLLMARGKAMQSALSILFQQRSVHKRYLAVVGGSLHKRWARLISLYCSIGRIVPSIKSILKQGNPR